jgi:hypothetical protein
MARSIEHHAKYLADAATVHATVTDAGFLRAKLERLGGTTAELVELTKTSEVTTVRTKHGIPAEKLPGAVRAMLGGDLRIERVETWKADGAGYVGTIEVRVSGAPGKLTGKSTLRGAETSCAQDMRGEVRVDIPLVGGKVEESVCGHISTLLDAEATFTERWLREH